MLGYKPKSNIFPAADVDADLIMHQSAIFSKKLLH